jgi:hypothetical protein
VITRVRNRPGVPADSAVEDQPDLVRPAQVEVVPDHLLEEDPAGHGLVEHLGQGELGLQDRHVVPVAGGPVRSGERVRQASQPLTQQGVDLGRSQAVADRLHRGHVGDGGEGVVQRGVGDASLGGLPLGPLVSVHAELGVVGKVGAELQEERPELGVHRVDVEVVHHTGGLDDPRVGLAFRVTALLGAKQRCLLLRPPDEQHSLDAAGRLEGGQVFPHHVVLALALDEIDPRHALLDGEAAHRDRERVGDLRQRRRRGHRQAELGVHVGDQPRRVLQPGHVDVQVHPVDALHLEDHVLGDDIGHRAR